MGNTAPLPATVQSAAIKVCRDALHWRDDLRAVFITAGVPAPLYQKYDDLGFSKAKLARAVFNELQERGEAGFVVQRKEILSANPSILEDLGRRLMNSGPLEVGETIGRRDEM